MSSKRLFIAVRPGSAILKDLVTLQQALKAQPPFPKMEEHCRWLPSENLHLTLHFMGAVAEASVVPLIKRLGEIGPFSPLTNEASWQTFDCWRGFPRPSEATVLALAGTATAPLLAEAFEKTKSILNDLGLVPESRPYLPHITLARFKRPTDLDLKGAPKKKLRLRVKSLALYESQLGSQGSRYEMIQEFPLLLRSRT